MDNGMNIVNMEMKQLNDNTPAADDVGMLDTALALIPEVHLSLLPLFTYSPLPNKM